MTRVAVTSRSFSKNPELRAALCSEYENVVFNDLGKTLEGEELIHFLKDCDSCIVGLERLDATVLNQLPKLKVISRFGVGLDTLDLVEIQERKIKIAYTAGANKRSVAELVLALALTTLRNLSLVNQQLRTGEWKQNKGRELSQSTVGIIGLGAVGKDLAILLKAFQCDILIYDPHLNNEFCETHQLTSMSLDNLLQQADIVSLHIPLNRETHHLLNAERLSLMKPSAILINTARGGLVDESALKQMLKTNQLAAAAFDVFETEPVVDKQLVSLPNFFATPHIGGSTEQAILAMGFAAIAGLKNAILLPEIQPVSV
jgi:phosphoglycerate dehydrogenase-like enzyme